MVFGIILGHSPSFLSRHVQLILDEKTFWLSINEWCSVPKDFRVLQFHATCTL